MTPLIDVVFLLLTFFVFASMLMVRARVLDVRLPTLRAGERAPAGDAITVAVRADGSVAVQGETLTLEEIPGRVRTLREAAPDARLLVAADEGGETGDFLALVDALTAAGLGEFQLVGSGARGEAPQPPDDDPPGAPSAPPPGDSPVSSGTGSSDR